MPIQLSHPIKVAIFCGGRGSATIINECLRRQNIQLTLIINAYDDGLSTGILRGFVAEMLGPSDFRKNIANVLDPHSVEQYALKDLLEFRLHKSFTTDKIKGLKAFLTTKDASNVAPELNEIFNKLSQAIANSVRQILLNFFSYYEKTINNFQFSDCSLGNLIFAGIYIQQGKNFNDTTKFLSKLVTLRANIVNVSSNENRVLVALKENGEILASEGQVVSQQSNAKIKKIYLLKKILSAEELSSLKNKSITEKEDWFQQHEMVPEISAEAALVLENADIIIYGPGTQHSSLYPSYTIASQHIKKSPAKMKALIMNLAHDHDTRLFSASDIMDHALNYLRDNSNTSSVISHVLVDEKTQYHLGMLANLNFYKNSKIIKKTFVNATNSNVHNGHAVVETILSAWQDALVAKNTNKANVEIFIDIHKRSLALNTLLDEFFELDWAKYFSNLTVTINKVQLEKQFKNTSIEVNTSQCDGIFPEVEYFNNWLHYGSAEYLILLTGDGEYRFRDLLLAIRLLDQSHFGAIFGSRNQSRVQFKSSLQAAYGDKKLLRLMSFLGRFFISVLLTVRYGLIFSDPLTGFRIFRRSKIIQSNLKNTPTIKTPMAITKYLIKHKIEIAELPVNYQTFSGFSDPPWRFERGFKNLLGVLLP